MTTLAQQLAYAVLANVSRSPGARSVVFKRALAAGALLEVTAEPSALRVPENATYASELSGEVSSGEADTPTQTAAAVAAQLLETARVIALATTTGWGDSATGSTGILSPSLALQV